VPPDHSLPYILQTDAPRIAISAILAQKGNDGKEHVICYASQKLLPRETKYADSVIELELLAVVFGVTKFNHYVYGRKIELQSDHRSLSYLSALLEHSPRLARWNLILSIVMTSLLRTNEDFLTVMLTAYRDCRVIVMRFCI